MQSVSCSNSSNESAKNSTSILMLSQEVRKMLVDEKMEFWISIEPEFPRFYIHKHDIRQEYGGPEEGGWYYESGVPVEGWNPADHVFFEKEAASAECRHLNLTERDRAKEEEEYEYTSVLSYRSTHYSYDVSEDPTPYYYPEYRPHYE